MIVLIPTPLPISQALAASTPAQVEAITRLVQQSAGAYNDIKEKYGSHTAVASAYNEIDKSVTKNLSQPFQKTISCKKGCSYCCEQLVAVSVDEAQYILDMARENKIHIDWKKARDQASRGIDSWIDRGKEKRTCVFLKDGACSIYEVRPGTCRNYHAYSPPDQCDVTNKDGSPVVPSLLHANAILAGIWYKQKTASLPSMLLKLRRKK